MTPRRWQLTLFMLLVTSTTGFLQPFVPLFFSASGLSRSQIGLITGIGTGLAVLVQPLLGRWSDCVDWRRPFIFVAALAAWLAYSAYPFAHSLPEFLVLTAIGSNGAMYLSGVGGVLVGKLVGRAQGGAEYARYRVWGSVGYIFVSLASGAMISLRGPSLDREALAPLFQFGPLLFLGIAGLAFLVPDARTNTPKERAKVERAPLPANLKTFLVAYLLYNFALYGSSPYLSLYMKSLGATGLWVTGMFAGGVVSEVLVMRQSGALSDLYGRRPALALAFVLLPIRLLLYAPATGPIWVAVVQILHGFNFGIVGAVAVAFANDLATDRTHGHAQSRLSAVAGIASALGPAALGVVSEAYGFRGMFVAAAAIALCAAALLLFGVHDSRANSRSLADQAPAWMRPLLGWLDTPPGKRGRRVP